MVRSRVALRGILFGCALVELGPACGDSTDGDDVGIGTSVTLTGTTGSDTGSTHDGTADDESSGPVSTSSSMTTVSTNGGDGDGDGDDDAGVCTDGVVDEGEQCDDGNMDDRDGCNNDCTISGSLLWEHTHASGLGATDQATGVAIDPESDAYVVGWVATPATGDDIWLRRYGAAGSLVWTRSVDGPASGTDRANGVARSPDGSLFVVGSVATVSASNDVWVARYDADGNQIWAQTYGGAPGGDDQGFAVATDGTGSAIVTGFHTVEVWVDEFDVVYPRNVWVSKYDPAGNVAWTVGHGGAALGHDAGLGVATDSAGNVVVVGYEAVAGQGRNMWIRKYDPAGGVLWTVMHDGPESLDDEATAVAIDVGDEILVAGQEGASAIPWRWWLSRYDAAGTVMWTRTWEGTTEEGARATGVSASNGIAVVTGLEREAGHNHVVVRKYGPDGFELWTTAVRGIEEANHVGTATALGADGRSYAVGGVDRGVDGRDAWIGRFAQ